MTSRGYKTDEERGDFGAWLLDAMGTMSFDQLALEMADKGHAHRADYYRAMAGGSKKPGRTIARALYERFGNPKPEGATTSNPAAPAAPAAAWWPSGFTAWSADTNVAYLWRTPGTFACTYSSATCTGITVVTRNGCPSSLYAEVSLADANGTAVGYTNDSVGSVRPGQQANLTFDSFEASAKTSRLSKISCY